MNEFDFIARLTDFAGSGIEGIGDDAALFGDFFLVAKDIIASDVHFLKSAPMDLIIHKLFTSNVSDIAAMGGTPLSVLFGISADKDTDLASIANAAKKASEFYGVKIIGGDTTESHNGLFFSLTIIGKKGQNLLQRNGARNGDILYLSRPVGLSKAALENELGKKYFPIENLYHYKINAEKDVGIFLGSRPEVTAATDVSDGLGADTGRLATMSDVKITIDEKCLKFPCLSFLGNEDVDYALSSGEEFALLFTVKKESAENFEKDYLKNLGKAPLKIGQVSSGNGSFLLRKGSLIDISKKGYVHF